MDTRPVDRATAARIEAAEARAWVDCYAAAPAEFAAQAGLRSREVEGTTVLSWAASGRRYFSRTIGLGVGRPARPETIDEIIRGYERDEISMFLLQSLPHCEPVEYEDWLHERGLEAFDAQDRVIRGPEPYAASSGRAHSHGLTVEAVTADSANEWAEFLQRVYRLDTGTWLQHLVGRPGWYPYLAREDDEIVGARTMFIGADRFAWLGMDGPVPGLTTDDYEPDAAICKTIVQDGLARGVRCFLADIEAPSDTMDTPAYKSFGRLGFRRPYVRHHYGKR
ncbi:MAG TPA: hypothetical protein VGI76_07470 [Solirubrobacteraceae bacterium]